MGRPSETREGLHREREYVKKRARGACEIRWWGPALHGGTDFAHVVARSQGGSDDHTNALWLCRFHHDAMTAPFFKGRLLVTRVVGVNGVPVLGFNWQFVRAANKFAYRRGEYAEIASGFIAAERVPE